MSDESAAIVATGVLGSFVGVAWWDVGLGVFALPEWLALGLLVTAGFLAVAVAGWSR